ncbi:oxidoreductase [Paracoccus methylarcula]|uniref:Oxidoreductase n=2 Tax=Paracoccus methylarcula TaxID=72022 RepID=A0A422QTF9_9RHOB|nr:nitroreductase [Paracoccus methylarcula]RNF33092.1 oxidoreductase [Paracoccus methylarcula]
MESEFEKLLSQRRSTRAFTGEPIGRAAIEHILRLARTAPSGANLQPGRFHALTGAALEGLVQSLKAAIAAGEPQSREYSYFPEPMPRELKARQVAAGYALYAALGIERRDIEARQRQFERNYEFFGAPVGIVVTIDRAMGKGCFMDLGMSLMALLLAAEDQGYAATGIGALAQYGPVVHRHLGLPEGEMVVCGIALGVADRDAPVNQVRTEREELPVFSRFYGFDLNS